MYFNILTIFGHFFANYMVIFHKTEVQTVILRHLTSLNVNWIKSYGINHTKLFFSILEEKKTENLSSKNGHFSTICGHFLALHRNLSQN